MIALCILTPLILLAAIGAVWKARPVHAALLLALSLAITAVLYVTIGNDFIGLVQFAVYVGAIAVLIVFSLLITRPGDEAEELDQRPTSMIPGLFCTLPVLGVLVYAVTIGSQAEEFSAAADSDTLNMSLEKIGIELFTTHAPAVIVVAVLLTAVMIGAALFAREPRKKQPPLSDS